MVALQNPERLPTKHTKPLAVLFSGPLSLGQGKCISMKEVRDLTIPNSFHTRTWRKSVQRKQRGQTVLLRKQSPIPRKKELCDVQI